jgi:hypothetical protein
MPEPMFGEANLKNGAREEPNLRLARDMERYRTVAREMPVPLVDHLGDVEVDFLIIWYPLNIAVCRKLFFK